MLDVRVSSAKTTSASFSMRMALNVISSIFPTGVGTRYNMPILVANILQKINKHRHIEGI